MKLPLNAICVAASLCCVFSSYASADSLKDPVNPMPWSFGVTAGTLGVGAEVSFPIYGDFVFRVNGSYIDLESGWFISSLDQYHFNATGTFAGGILDYHPFGNGWRGSVGVRYVDIELKGVAANGIQFDGSWYSTSEVGKVTATVHNSNPVAPYLGFGYDATVYSSDNWGVNLGFDLGAMYIGEPNVSVKTAITPPYPYFASDVAAGTATIKDHIRNFDFYPVGMFSARLDF